MLTNHQICRIDLGLITTETDLLIQTMLDKLQEMPCKSLRVRYHNKNSTLI